MIFSVFTVATILIFGIFFYILIVLIVDNVDKKFLINIFLISLSVKVILSIFLYLVSLFYHPWYKQEFFIGDGIGFNHNGIWLSHMWQRHIYPDMNTVRRISWSGTVGAYDYWNGFVYYMTTPNPFSIFVINCILGSFTIMLVYLIANNIFDKRIAKLSSIFVAFWPSLNLWSTQNLKDPLLFFFTALGAWALLSMIKRFRFRYVFILLCTIYVFYLMRSLMFPVFLLVTYALFTYSVFIIMKKILGPECAIAIIICGNLLLLEVFLKISYGYLGFNNIIKWINLTRESRAYGNLSFLENIRFVNIPFMIALSPLFLLFTLFAPFPWQVGSFSQSIAVPEMLIWYLLIPATFNGIKYIWKHKKPEHIFLLFFILTTLLLLGILEGNAGSLFRHRSTALVLFLIVTSLGLLAPKKYMVT